MKFWGGLVHIWFEHSHFWLFGSRCRNVKKRKGGELTRFWWWSLALESQSNTRSIPHEPNSRTIEIFSRLSVDIPARVRKKNFEKNLKNKDRMEDEMEI